MRHISLRGIIYVIVPIVCCALFYGSSESALAPSLTIPGKENTPGTAPLEEDLFKRLLGDEPQELAPDENPLESAIKGMLDAEKRIGNRNIGEETQNIQKKVVDDLQKLIDLANQRQQQSQRRRQNSRRQRNQQQNGARQQGPQQQQKPSSPSGQNRSGQQNRKQPGDSGAGARVGETNSSELLRQRRMLEEVWGHLPPALRERMQNVISEKYLPKYDEMIRRYFKSLAQDEKSRRRK
ncbi:MAG: hypothetical protein IH899_08805 [Planctomycetes bacterium]|nr:hypothetical protein [Planctomycetota bacterium]